MDNAGDSITELADGGTDRVLASLDFSLVTVANVENLTLATGAGLIAGTGNALNNVIIGNESANILTGGIGNDSLSGGDRDDELLGGVGSDRLDGGLGVDQMTGGSGRRICRRRGK